MKNRVAKAKQSGRDKRKDDQRPSQATSVEFEREGLGIAAKE